MKTKLHIPVATLFYSNADRTYNTLDFASKIVCQQGLLVPIGNPEPRDTPSGLPVYFIENGIQTTQIQFETISQKYKTATTSILHRDENCSGFLSKMQNNFSDFSLLYFTLFIKDDRHIPRKNIYSYSNNSKYCQYQVGFNFYS